MLPIVRYDGSMALSRDQLARLRLPCRCAALAQNHIAGYPIEPRQWLSRHCLQTPPSHEKRLCRDLISQITPDPTLSKRVHSRIVRLE